MMRFSYHLIGNKVDEFTSIVSVPHSVFYRNKYKDKEHVGVYLTSDNVPKPTKSCGVQHIFNSRIVPQGFSYCLYYGDVRRGWENKCIPVVCDIMDIDYWYYYRSLRHYGIFTFSVDTSLCDPVVYKCTISLLANEAQAVYYEELI